ncbi:GNAT family N-acetyltransferase [Silicimonas sp. MF1-12-2]|uniref:GNAT family N-acetyltransferase n=1 Tax=Silicimonas sp. MF1-12-2 TaxID=3384793 RepID=UPI0039B37185
MRFFGSADQQAMGQRGANLFALVQDDPRFAWYGRNVTLVDFSLSELDTFESLVRLQGATAGYRVRRELEHQFRAALETRGLRSDVFGFSVSADDTSVEKARRVLRDFRLPDDLDVSFLAPDSADGDVEAFAEIALMADVLPPPDTVLRGQARRGVALVARERGSGRPVGCAASFANFHPDSIMADTCFWGMLATHPDRRGEKIALVLGAKAMIAMHEKTGIGKFSTGIRDDNIPSERLCEKLGVVRSDYLIIIGMDPDAFRDARITK